MITALCSAKGSPGVTVTALCLAAAVAAAGAGKEETLLVEADPAGGDLECWNGPHGESGLVALAAALGTGVTGTDPLRHAVPLGTGVRGLVAPTTELAAEAALLALGDRLPVVTAGRSSAVVVDAGRWAPSQPTADRLAGADLALVVCRPTLDGVEHARGLLSSLRATLDLALGVVVVGDAPYAPDDIERALEVPVVGALPWEPRAVLSLVSDGPEARAWRRSRLVAVAGELAGRLSKPAAEATVDG